jgi:hypothetical protein
MTHNKVAPGNLLKKGLGSVSLDSSAPPLDVGAYHQGVPTTNPEAFQKFLVQWG